jgi:putative ABC transport system ATP-binding protein
MKGTEGALPCARGLRKDSGTGEGLMRALDEVDLEIARGESVAVR